MKISLIQNQYMSGLYRRQYKDNYSPIQYGINSFGNISFGKTAIYAKKLGDNSQAQRFDSIIHAQNILGVPGKNINIALLRGDSNVSGGYMFIEAEKVEKNGSVDSELMKEFLSKAGNYASNKAVYAVSIRNDDSKPVLFKTMAEAHKALNIDASNIYSVLIGTSNSAKGYVFVKGSDVQNDDGTTDVKKLDNIVKAAKKYGASKAVYAQKIGSDDYPLRFNSIPEAEKALGFRKKEILYTFKDGKTKEFGDYLFIKADSIEKNGIVDEAEMNKFINLVKRYEISNAIYAQKIGSNEYPIRFKDKKQAQNALGINAKYIASNLRCDIKSTSGYVFISGEKLVDSDGKIDAGKMADFIDFANSCRKYNK